VTFIGIAGPSCAGKSALAAQLLERLPAGSAAVLPLDAYYNDLSHLPSAQRALQNFDEPDALDWPLFEQHFRDLAAGLTVERPVYDFATHTRRREHLRIAPARFVLAEGLLLLCHAHIRTLLDLAVYVDAPDSVCLTRRIERDVRERGRTPESVTHQFRETVAPMTRRYVCPTREHADIVVDGTAPLDPAVRGILQRLSASSPDRPSE